MRVREGGSRNTHPPKCPHSHPWNLQICDFTEGEVKVFAHVIKYLQMRRLSSLDFPGGPSVIARVLLSEGGRQRSESEGCSLRTCPAVAGFAAGKRLLTAGAGAGPGSWERNIGVSTRPSGKDRALILARKTHFRLVNSRTVGYIYVVLSRVVRGSLQGDEQREVAARPASE